MWNGLIFLSMALWTVLTVAVRRLFQGPLHPGWSYRFEVLAEILRKANERGVGLSVEQMRRGLPPSRIHPRIAPALRHERTAVGDLRTEVFTPLDWKEPDPTILYLHGGGYVVCSPATHRDLISRIAVASGARCVAPRYRKAPEHPFPAPIDDAEAAYRRLLDDGVPAERLFVAGDSAGGGLTLALLQRLREASLPLPRAAVLLSPWVDLECRGESIARNAPFDYLPVKGLPWGASQYLQGGDARDPLASPIHADLGGLPPLFMQTGGAELFLSENCLLAERASAAGVEVVHEIEDGMIHVFQAFATFLPECEPAIGRIGAFIRTRAAAA